MFRTAHEETFLEGRDEVYGMPKNENQKNKKGLSFIEVVSNCNSGWKMTAPQANEWMEQNMFAFYPLGDIKVDGKLVK